MPRTSERLSGPRERLFVGVPLPEHLLSLVQEAQSALPETRGLRLMRPKQLHVTLAFIGEVEAAKREAARSVVEGLPADAGGVAELDGYLFLPGPSRPRVVALHIDDRAGAFAGLFERVMSGLEAAEAMRREKRPFRAHLTIARLREPANVRPRSERGRAAYPVQSVCLYRSELRREGAHYTVLARREFITGTSA